jgi:RNA-directed DNA polymerase
VRDRVVQTAVLLILEPIFEADFLDCSYGYRPARSAKDALQAVDRNLREGYRAIYDADLKGYFDSIPHDKLMKCVERRVADGSVLQLLRLWLKVPVVERKEGGPPTVSRPTSGTPQGGVISPLLANLYLHWLDVRFHRADGPAGWARARLVRYADDFVIMAKGFGDRMTKWVEETVEGWLGLTINREKTRVIALVPRGDARLDFLGYTFRYEWGYTNRTRRFLTVIPSVKAIAREREKLRKLTDSKHSFVPLPALVRAINRQLQGWANYFDFGYPRLAYRAVNAHVLSRLKLHLQRRSQRACRPPAGMTYYQFLTRRLGLELL